MSSKNLDNHNRWRNRTVAFRVSDEENAQIDLAVKLTGLIKQDYITRILLCKDVVVQGNPRVHKALRDQFATLLDTINLIAIIMDGMKEKNAYGLSFPKINQANHPKPQCKEKNKQEKIVQYSL